MREEKKNGMYLDRNRMAGDNRVEESAPLYGSSAPTDAEDEGIDSTRQGTYTVEDYLALPQDQRCELIDGVLYAMAAPTPLHQMIVVDLIYALKSCVHRHHLACKPLVAPIDVQLDADDRTMVQPDVIVCCDPSLIREGRVVGAPEFVAEVISPSSRQRDVRIKRRKYRDAGVKEYWLLDPESRQVTVFVFDGEERFSAYSFEDHIPVAISEGRCEVCLSPDAEQPG